MTGLITLGLGDLSPEGLKAIDVDFELLALDVSLGMEEAAIIDLATFAGLDYGTELNVQPIEEFVVEVKEVMIEVSIDGTGI